MRYGFIYETTNLITGHKYIGQHKRSQDINDPDDSWYLGSGLMLGNAIESYGVENFSRRIIEDCDSAEELNEREVYHIRLVDAVNSHEYYNLSDAPQSGYPVTKGMKLPEYWKEHLSEAQKIRYHTTEDHPLKDPKTYKKISQTLREGYESGRIKKLYGEDNPATRSEVKEKISITTQEAMRRPEVHEKMLAFGARLSNDSEFSKKISEGRLGENNPCYGKIWINNGEYNRRVYREEFINEYQSQGFLEGRLSKSYGPRKRD